MKVDSLGFWVNQELINRFVPFVDRISESEREVFRSTSVYRDLLSRGAADRSALIGTSLAEIDAFERMRALLSGVDSSAKLIDLETTVLSDSLVADFVTELKWIESTGEVAFKGVSGDIWVILGLPCAGDPASVPNPRVWGEYLPYLMGRYCKQIELTRRLAHSPASGEFRAATLGSGYGYVVAPTRAKLLEELNR